MNGGTNKPLEGTSQDSNKCLPNKTIVHVNVIVPVHNAASTIEEAVRSAMDQELPEHYLTSALQDATISFSVCCYDDGSKDDSLTILQRLKEEFLTTATSRQNKILSTLLGWLVQAPTVWQEEQDTPEIGPLYNIV
jgi:cellulose synthase/poly-beta-1,6-N-acetylglucosamine synthase-like glycosyltransferase